MHDQLIEIVFKNISTENIGYILKDLTSDGQEVVSCNITSDELEIDWNDESSIRRMFQNNTGFGVFINIKELNGKFICLPKCGIAVYKNGDSIDLEINFGSINEELSREIERFEPTGLGNPTPVFSTKKVNITDARIVGQGGKHLKLNLVSSGIILPAIAFNMGEYLPSMLSGGKFDIAYTIEKNVWNGNETLQLKIKDIKM